MENKAMEDKLAKNECIDVNVVGTPLKDFEGKVWEIYKFLEDVDYCDAKGEQWIWSIGRRKTDGKMFAAIDGRFHDNPMFKCLWLR